MCHGANGTNEKNIYMHMEPHTLQRLKQLQPLYKMELTETQPLLKDYCRWDLLIFAIIGVIRRSLSQQPIQQKKKEGTVKVPNKEGNLSSIIATHK
jgi:hypothetical protein